AAGWAWTSHWSVRMRRSWRCSFSCTEYRAARRPAIGSVAKALFADAGAMEPAASRKPPGLSPRRRSGNQPLGQFQRLALEQAAIDAALETDERVMIALFDDPAPVEDEQAVQRPDSGQPVGNDQRGAADHQPLHRLLDL